MTGEIVDLNALPIAVEVAGYRAEFLYWGACSTTRPWRNYLHSHSFFEICYAYAGRGTYFNRGIQHDVRAGELFIARPGEIHEIVADDADPLGIYFWSYALRATDNADGLLTAFAAADGRLISARTGSIPILLELLDREAARAEIGMQETVFALTRALVVATARAVVDSPAFLPGAYMLPGADAAVGARGAAAVRSMVRYLHDNYERELLVRDVAAQVHMSERHASRLFRRATGTPIRGYLQKLRLEAAAERLVERGPSVKEIAHSCGYPDVRHFTTAFRREFGLTPVAFRQLRGTRFQR